MTLKEVAEEDRRAWGNRWFKAKGTLGVVGILIRELRKKKKEKREKKPLPGPKNYFLAIRWVLSFCLTLKF